MNPGDRIREEGSGRLGFVLYTSNMNDDTMVVRFDGQDWNTPVGDLSRFEVLPSEPFRPEPAAPTVTVKYHIAYWPYDDSGGATAHRATHLHSVPARWVPPVGAFVDEITFT